MVRYGMVLLAVGGAGIAAAAAPGDKPVETLTRSGKWVANYDRDSCTVVAPMGEGANGVAVKFTRFAPDDVFDLSLVGNRFAQREMSVDGTADFGVTRKPIAVEALAGDAGKYPALFFGAMRIDGWHSRDWDEAGPRITAEQQGRVTGVTVALRGKRPLRLEFGSLTAPMTVMHQCMDALIRRWGYDPAEQAAAQRPVSPINRPTNWLKPDEPSIRAMLRGHKGIVQFRLDVDPQGKVAGCTVLAQTNPADFGEITCRSFAKRARLQPALDAQGKPMRAFWVGSVRWGA